MIWKNAHSLPAPLVRAIKGDNYPKTTGKTISVTSIIKPAQARELERLHDDEIVTDVSDHIYRLLGQSCHAVLEKAAGPGDVSEERFKVEFEGWTISGQVDLVEADGTLSDLKVTSVYSFLLGTKNEWVQQCNVYKWLAEKNGLTIKKMQIVAILRDWQSSKAGPDEPDYPSAPSLTVPVEIWPTEKVEAFLRERLALHAKAAEKPSSAPCSAEERWERGEKFAVMQKGRKRALRLLPSYGEAQTFITNTGLPNLEIDHRPALQRRCESFCMAAPWCEQRKALGVKLRGE